ELARHLRRAVRDVVAGRRRAAAEALPQPFVVHVHDGPDRGVELVDGRVRERLGGCLHGAAATDSVAVDVVIHEQRVMPGPGVRDVAGARTAHQELAACADAHADVAVADPELGVLADEAGLVERTAPAVELCDRVVLDGTPVVPVHRELGVALVDPGAAHARRAAHGLRLHDARRARSGNSAARPRSLASHTPLSVMSPVTSRAGVTSNAMFLTGVLSGSVRTSTQSSPAMPRTTDTSSGPRSSIGIEASPSSRVQSMVVDGSAT